MSEIINIWVGGAGNHIGNAFLSQLLNEHWLDYDGLFTNKIEAKKANKHIDISEIETRLNKINSYFREVNTELFDGYIRSEIERKYSTFVPKDIRNLLKYYLLHHSHHRFIPRTILIDTEPSVLDEIRMSNTGNLFNQSNFHHTTESAGGNWAKGHYTIGSELIDQIVDSIRNETEKCDVVQAFEICHSLGGGTGSGLATLLLIKLRDNYPDRIKTTFSVITRANCGCCGGYTEPYNQILSLHQMCENADITLLFENDKFRNIFYNVLSVNEPKYCDFNWIMSQSMSGITSTLRLQSTNNLNENWRKMGINMVTFQRLHFLMNAQTPLFLKGFGKDFNLTIQELGQAMFSASNFMCDIHYENGKYLSASSIFRGSACSMQEIDDEIGKIDLRKADDWISWIPNNIGITTVDVSLDETEKSGTMVANTTAIKSVFQKLSARFARSYKRKAFLHWYKNEGMDEMEFQEADKNVRDLIVEYQDKQDAVVDLDDCWEYDDDDDDDDEDDEDDDEDGEDDDMDESFDEY